MIEKCAIYLTKVTWHGWPSPAAVFIQYSHHWGRAYGSNMAKNHYGDKTQWKLPCISRGIVNPGLSPGCLDTSRSLAHVFCPMVRHWDPLQNPVSLLAWVWLQDCALAMSLRKDKMLCRPEKENGLAPFQASSFKCWDLFGLA